MSWFASVAMACVTTSLLSLQHTALHQLHKNATTTNRSVNCYTCCAVICNPLSSLLGCCCFPLLRVDCLPIQLLEFR